MSFEELMAAVVGRRIMNNAVLRRPWDEFQRTGDTVALSRECGDAKDIPDTEIGALYYCLTYQKTHFDALTTIIRQEREQFATVAGRWLIVDFGAGPGTALLAWSSYLHGERGAPVKVSYVHIDSSDAMNAICSKYFAADAHVASGSSRWQISSLEKANITEWVAGVDQALFVFSYVLCQPSVKDAVVQEFAQTVANTCTALADKPAYLLMADANLPHVRWRQLDWRLRRCGVTVRAANPTRTIDCQAVYLRPDGSERDRRDNRGRIIYDVIRLQ